MSTSLPTHDSPPPMPARSWMDRLLSPQGIHALLGSGGGLFAIGVISWLATLGLFEHPLVLAGSLGSVNLLLLLGGFLLYLRTRFQLAGLALTLLACLLMPLHLWFYHAQQLLTFDNHLWLAALVISLLYAITARVLRNVWFVPVFLGGIALTTLLILADLGQFWQITAPAISLCLLGILAIHTERLFPVDEASPFRRTRFGLAFFWSGHALLGLGLLLVLLAQLAGGPLYQTYTHAFYDSWHVTRTELVTTSSGKLTALLLVLAGVYAHLYSDLVVRRKGYYLQIAAMLMLWIEIIILDLLNISLEKESLVGILAGTGLLLQLLHRTIGKQLPERVNLLPHLAMLLTVSATALGMLFYLVDTLWYLDAGLRQSFPAIVQQTLLISVVLAGVTNLAGAYFSPQQQGRKLCRDGASLSLMLIAALLIAMFVSPAWITQTGSIMGMALVAVTLAWRIAPLKQLGTFAHLFVAQWLILGMPYYVVLQGEHSVMVGIILLAAAGFYLLTAVLLQQLASIPMALITALLGCVHLFAWLDVAMAYKLAIGAGVGAIVTILGVTSSRLLVTQHPISTMLVKLGQTLFFVCVLGSVLLAVQTMLANTTQQQAVPAIVTLLLEAACCWGFYAGLRKNSARTLYLAFSWANVVLAGLLVVTMLHLPLWRKLELASLGLGIGLTMLGFRAWLQESQDRQRQNSVSPLFLLGSLLICIPVAFVVMTYRQSGQFMVMDEASMLVLGVLLFAAGCVCQLRIPALAGSILMLLYLAGLLLYVPWGHLGTASLILAGCGGTVFLLGLALSIFRDQLLALPSQVKERRGIFQVLGWR